MKQLFCVVALSVVVCLLSGCARNEPSPLIVCDLDGKVVPTAFTFAGFQQTLAAEHGHVEATGYEKLETRSVVVFFKRLANGTVLAERAIAVETGAPMPPSILFGLKSAPTITPSAQAQPYDPWASNVPAFTPATN